MAWLQNLSAVYNFIRPVLDIAIIAFLLYKTWELLAKTHALQLVKGAGLLVLIFIISWFLKLNTLQWVLRILGPGLFLTIAIIFQPELRRIIIRLGQGKLFSQDSKQRIGELEAVVSAAQYLSRKKRGMLAVFPRKIDIKNIIDTGTIIDSDISCNLIETIFEFDGPLHDGAIVIQYGKIAAAGCFLPLSEQKTLFNNLGTRHLASLGMAEHSDAVVLIVSEESGAMSLAYDSKLEYNLSSYIVTQKLKGLLALEDLVESGQEKMSKGKKDSAGEY